MFDATFAVIENERQRNELAEFYSKYKDRFCWIAYLRLKNRNDAEDAVQELFSEIADKPERFFDIPPESRLAYADIMIRNIAVDMFGAKNKVRLVELDEETEDTSISLENDILDSISRSELLLFLKQLPTPLKTVLLLHVNYELTIYEIAQRLKVSITTVNKRLRQARSAIRQFIDERNSSHE